MLGTPIPTVAKSVFDSAPGPNPVTPPKAQPLASAGVLAKASQVIIVCVGVLARTMPPKPTRPVPMPKDLPAPITPTFMSLKFEYTFPLGRS